MSKTLDIIEVLNKRGGFDDWWGNIDEEIQEEILEKLEKVLDSSKDKNRIQELEDGIETSITGLEWIMDNEKEKMDKSDYEHYDMLRALIGKKPGDKRRKNLKKLKRDLK